MTASACRVNSVITREKDFKEGHWFHKTEILLGTENEHTLSLRSTLAKCNSLLQPFFFYLFWTEWKLSVRFLHLWPHWVDFPSWQSSDSHNICEVNFASPHFHNPYTGGHKGCTMPFLTYMFYQHTFSNKDRNVLNKYLEWSAFF